MNIFVLDKNPVQAAQYHCDKHVVKMVLESAQLLSTVNHKCHTWFFPMYKPTHQNHPCTLWLMESKANYKWCWDLFNALCREYTFRYNKIHASSSLLWLLSVIPKPLPDIGLTPFAQAMPTIFKSDDAVLSYRQYYQEAKAQFLTYRNRPFPDWLPPPTPLTLKPK